MFKRDQESHGISQGAPAACISFELQFI